VGNRVRGNYNLAPGLFVVAEYMYQQRHQGGYDFAAGAVTTTGATRDSRSQGILFATVVNGKRCFSVMSGNGGALPAVFSFWTGPASALGDACGAE